MVKQLFIFIFLTNAVYGQDLSGTSQIHLIDSKVYSKERTIELYEPFGLQTQPTAQPEMVLYVFDAQFEPYFDMVVRTADYLNAIGEFPSFVAVGIHTEHRPKEFTPAPVNEDTRTGWGDTPIGESASLENHLEKEVFPFVENAYPTAKIKVGIGHSLGGTFVSSTLFSERNLFKAIISISPNMSYDNAQLLNAFDSLLSSEKPINAYHFMVAGNVGNMENAFRRNSSKVDSLYQLKPAEGLVWEYKEYDGLNHSLTPLPAITDGLIKLGQLTKISDEEALQFLADSSQPYGDHILNHYRELSDWLGFELTPSVDALNDLGYLAAYEEDWESALTVFEKAIALHPDDANIYDSKGEALENLGKPAEANAMYNKAIEKLELNKDRYDSESYAYYSETFKANAERVKP